MVSHEAHVKPKPIRCFIHLAPVGNKQNPLGPTRWVAQLIARGTGSDLYSSKPCATQDEAIALAKKYLAKEKGVTLT